ncbi:uncharacterized protein LOC108203740 [Daucus carota subsp. sativus]|uniref:uncharacterized protein LOC108203740 n=1 Tax=Daucus carota subsp. sativus TaxID=79200 RepID=UPI0007F0021D|nr:PREDICTED: uncharacterized protein LOC108203740 [Daucus carota subsp. sativus]
MARLCTVQFNDNWDLGSSNYFQVRELRSLCENIQIGSHDKITWNGSLHVKTSSIYFDISEHIPTPRWVPFIWHNFHVPKFAFTSWLILKGRLLTKDRMLNFSMNADQRCILCMTHNENHEHLFCDCDYTKEILNACPVGVRHSWANYCNGDFFIFDLDQTEMKVASLYISAAYYHLWAERNLRVHNPGQYNSPGNLIKVIKEAVRGKLYSCKGFQRLANQDPTIHGFLY